MNLRKKMNHRTTIHFQGNAILRKLLPSLESSKGGLKPAGEGGSTTSISAEHLSELQRIMTSHKGTIHKSRRQKRQTGKANIRFQ